jgi:hypothetical protein
MQSWAAFVAVITRTRVQPAPVVEVLVRDAGQVGTNQLAHYVVFVTVIRSLERFEDRHRTSVRSFRPAIAALGTMSPV